ncbi:DIL domain-containing protein [Chytridium lagenaria]|nr:DIL domain-containing protein [Chytridium lagenaria]
MFVSKKMLRSLRREKAAVLLQSVWRGYRVRQEYRRSRRSIIYLQSCIRRKRARRELAQLKVEAKSVGKLKEVNYGLETKIVALSQQLQGKAEEVRGLMEKVSLLETSVNGWKERVGGDDGIEGWVVEGEGEVDAGFEEKEEEMVLKEEEGKRLAEKLRVTQGNKRLSMVTASALRTENIQLKRLLAQQNQSNSTPNVASSGTPPSSPPDDARPPLPVTGMTGILEDAERARLRLLAENLSKAEAKSRQDATRQVMNEEELIKARETAKEEAEMRMRELRLKPRWRRRERKQMRRGRKAKLEEERRMKEVEEHKMMLAEVVAQKAVLVGSGVEGEEVRVDVNGYPVSTPPSELNSPVVHQPHPIPSVGPYDRRFAPSPTRGSPTHPTFHSLQSPITNQPFSPPLTSPASSHSSRTPLHDAPHNTNSYFPQPAQLYPPTSFHVQHVPVPKTTTTTTPPIPRLDATPRIPQRVGSGTFPTSPHDMYPKAPSPQPSVASSARSGDYGGRRTSDASFGGAIHGNGRTSVDGGGMRAPTIGPRKDQLHYTNGVNGSGGATMRNALPARVYSLEKDTGTLEQRALEQPELIKEIRNSLVISLKVPVGGAGNSLPAKTFFFPAHLIGYTIRAMLQYDMTIKLQNMMSMIVEDIFNVGVHSDNDMYPIFWISNVQELICIIATLYFTETKKASAGNVRGHVHVLRKLRSDLDSLMTQLMSGYMEDTKRHVAGMAVGAILDTQDLAHMKVEASGSFWSLFGGNAVTGTTGSLVGLKDYLTNLNDIMESYFVTADHRDHILNELLRVLGVTSFNGLLKKRNFSNYKRGAQIHHNVTRLEEWCLKNRVSQGVDYLQRMLQSSKILTLPKTTAEDVEVIYETGYMLNRNQIRHLLQDYPSNDVDEPMSNAFMRIIARKAEETEHMETVFISLDPEPDYAEPMPHPVTVMDNYIPPGLNLTNVAKLVAGFS